MADSTKHSGAGFRASLDRAARFTIVTSDVVSARRSVTRSLLRESIGRAPAPESIRCSLGVVAAAHRVADESASDRETKRAIEPMLGRSLPASNDARLSSQGAWLAKTQAGRRS